MFLGLARARAGWGKSKERIKSLPKIRQPSERAKRKRGVEKMNFCPPASPPKADNGVGKRFRNSCDSRNAKQKNFLFLNCPALYAKM